MSASGWSDRILAFPRLISRRKERDHGDGPEAAANARIEYPTGDGKPVAETGLHVRELLGAFQLLDDHFASQPTVFVGANMFLYYVKGNRRKHISPDVFVTRGIAKEPRAIVTWSGKKGRPPISSSKSRPRARGARTKRRSSCSVATF